MLIDIDHLRQWIGNSQTLSANIDVATCQRMEATLDLPQGLGNGDPLPPLWHWLYFHQPAMLKQLDRDGHSMRGGFIPSVPLPRRMWAGGRFQYSTPLLIGEEAQKLSEIKSVDVKSGRSGELCFVTIAHQLSMGSTICLREEHDIVYRSDPLPGEKPVPPQTAKGNADWSRTITPSPVLLFRYSALTFNSHRIHYDRDYCRDVEAYPGLVFHGPLTATLLLKLAMEHSNGRALTGFEFRALSPLFDVVPFELRGWDQGDKIELQAVTAEGGLAMKAVVAFG